MCNVRPVDMIFAGESRSRLQLNTLLKYLHNRILLWFGHLERMEDCYLPSKCE